MGCELSAPKSKADPKEDKRNKKQDNKDGKGAATNDAASAEVKDNKSGSLDIPVPPTDAVEKDGAVSQPLSVANTARSGRATVDGSAPRGRSSTARHNYLTEKEPSPDCPMELQTIMDGMSDSGSHSSSSSAPQLFRISPTSRDEAEPGTWSWWRQKLRRDHVTKDGYCRVQLQDVQTRLTCQHDENPENVELDFSSCYMERTAPYVIGRLLASTQLRELRWITSLRLDGNYFTDDGFGAMLSIMSAENQHQTLLPLLRQLYLNNMNLDSSSVTGLLAHLFPVNRKATRSLAAESACRIAGSRAGRPSEAFIAAHTRGPVVPLFPALSVLSLSDNPGLGSAGLVHLLRHLLAVHYEPNTLSVMDLSRCGFDRSAAGYLREYFEQLPRAMEAGCYPVVPRRFVLLGNKHGVVDPHDIYSPENTGVQLVL